jgi:hypothetical protein
VRNTNQRCKKEKSLYKNVFCLSMKSPLLLLFLLAGSLAFGQGTISGRIIDAESKEPLAGASVFAQNTTKGTTSDKEGAFSLYLNKGGYEVIITFTGYASRKINYEAVSDRQFTIELQKEDKSLSEVVIRSSNEVADGWEKYGKFFTDHFIGTTPFADSCTLLNPQALKFYYYKRSDRLKVLATEPLQISNRALGYNLNYQLDSFVYHYQKDLSSYRGNCLFQPIEGSAEEQSLWTKNREAAYRGSRLHFVRSYYDSTLKQEGFTVDLLSPTNPNKFDRLANPYDTSYYFFDDSTGNAELYFPAKVSIAYTKKAPEKRYLQQMKLPLNVGQQLSYVVLTDGITIMPNGYFLEQQSWVNQGYWSWKNLADMVPYDY